MQLDFNSIKLMKLTKCKRVGRKVNLGLGLNGDPNSPFHFINHPSINFNLFHSIIISRGAAIAKGSTNCGIIIPTK